MYMLGFPLLLVPFAIYNIVAFLMPGVSWTGTWSRVHMISGADWTMSAGDMLVGARRAGAVRRGDEIDPHRRAHRGRSRALAHPVPRHAGRVPAGARRPAAATFFLLLVISFVDVLGGFAVTLRTAQRDLTVEGIQPHL